MRKPIVQRLREPIIIGASNWERILEERAEAASVIERTTLIAQTALKRLKDNLEQQIEAEKA